MKSRNFIKGSIAFSLALSMAVTSVSVTNIYNASAAAKIKLSKSKLSITKGDTATLRVKNAKKKVKWSVNKKKIVKITKKSGKKKEQVVIKGVKVGKAVVVAKVGKKKVTCKVTVKKPIDNFKKAAVDTYDSKCILLTLKKADSKLKEADLTVTTKSQKAGKYHNQITVKKLVKASAKQYRVYLSRGVENGSYVNIKSGISTADAQRKSALYVDKEKQLINENLKKGSACNIVLSDYVNQAIGNVRFSLKKGQSLPEGLSLDSKFTNIQGIPTAVGSKTVTFVAKDELGRKVELKVNFNVFDETAVVAESQSLEYNWTQKDTDDAVAYNAYNASALDSQKKYYKDIEINPVGGSGVYNFTLDAGDCPEARLSTDQFTDDAAKTKTQRNGTSTTLRLPYSITEGKHTFNVTITDAVDTTRTTTATITVNIVKTYQASGAVKSSNGNKVTSGKVYFIPKGAKSLSEAYSTTIQDVESSNDASVTNYSVAVPDGTYTVKVDNDVMYEMANTIKVKGGNKVAQVTVPEKFYAVSGKATYSDANNQLKNETLYFELVGDKYEHADKSTAAFYTTTDKYGAFAVSLPSNSYAVYFKDEKGKDKYFAGSLVVKDKDQVVTLKSSVERFKVEGIAYNGTAKDATSQVMDVFAGTDLYFYNSIGKAKKVTTDEMGAYTIFLEGGNTYVVRAEVEKGVLRTIGTVSVDKQNATGVNIIYSATKDTVAAAAVEYPIAKLGTELKAVSNGCNDLVWKISPTEAGAYTIDASTALGCGGAVYVFDENLHLVGSGKIDGDNITSAATPEVTATPVITVAPTIIPTRTPCYYEGEVEEKHTVNVTLEAGKMYFVQVIPYAKSTSDQGQGDVAVTIKKYVAPVRYTFEPVRTYPALGDDDENNYATSSPSPSPTPYED